MLDENVVYCRCGGGDGTDRVTTIAGGCFQCLCGGGYVGNSSGRYTNTVISGNPDESGPPILDTVCLTTILKVAFMLTDDFDIE